MDTSLIEIDVQPNYVRVTLKGKSLQISFNEEVKPDSSTAKRSQTTGHLVIKMPKLNPILRKIQKNVMEKKNVEKKIKENELLDIVESKKSMLDILKNIQESNKNLQKSKTKFEKNMKKERENSDNFVDDETIPPLE